ncbi:MAG: MOSC domain-containing protein [Pseudomonadales bacterium]
MHVTSINVGAAKRLSGKSFSGLTGIFKEPVTEPVAVGTLGITGDAVLNARHHGGPDQAVYLYRQEDYEWWSASLTRPVLPGTFGENLTVSGLPGPDLAIGTRLTFDEVVLEVTAPRIPCNTLAERMEDARFAKTFVRAERPGCYCRVLTPGALRTGERFSVDAGSASDVTVLALFRAAGRRLEREELEWFLAAPIDERTRRKFEDRLSGI